MDSRSLSPDLGDAERAYCFSVAMKYLRDEEAAADVAQEALLSAHRHRASFRGNSRYSTWLYRVAATSALMYLRKQKRRSREVLAPAGCDNPVEFLECLAESACSPEEECACAEAIHLAADRLGELGEKYERIFWMRYRDGYTESEIASELELALSTVKTRAHRARVAVREHLTEVLQAA